VLASIHDPIVAVMCSHVRRKQRIRGGEAAASGSAAASKSLARAVAYEKVRAAIDGYRIQP
jgi:hypothetical protein